MKPLFDLVDTAIKEPLQGCDKLRAYLRDTQSSGKGTDLSSNELLDYTIKRLVKATTVNDHNIKENAAYGLRFLLEEQHENVDFQKLRLFVTEATDSKNAIKKGEVAHFVIGKIMVVRALAPYLKEHQKSAWFLLQPIIDTELGEQALDTIYEVLKLHPNKKVLSELQGQHLAHNPRLDLLKSLICQRLKHQKTDHAIDVVEQVAGFVVPEYPRKNYIVGHLVDSIKWPSAKWQECWSRLLANYSDETKHGFRGIYFILEVFKHLACGELSKEVIDSVLYKDLLDLWMNQLVVLNKHCRELASSIELNVGEDQEKAFRVLEFLHEQHVIIGNIQKKHPLQSVYRAVNPVKFLKYLMGRLEAQYNEDQLCEAYAYVRLATKEVPSKLVTKVMTKLIEQKKENELSADKYYGMLWSLLGWRLAKQQAQQQSKKQDNLAQARLLLDVYNKLKKEQDGEVDKAAEYVAGLLQASDDNTSDRMKAFVRFAAAIILWSGITGEELQTCHELLMLGPDFAVYCELVDATEKPRKKRKTEDPKKPIHVLVEMFIAYLTRAPNFLRDAIEGCFKTLISDLDKSDLSTLIAVLTRPDNEYIEDDADQEQE